MCLGQGGGAFLWLNSARRALVFSPFQARSDPQAGELLLPDSPMADNGADRFACFSPLPDCILFAYKLFQYSIKSILKHFLSFYGPLIVGVWLCVRGGRSLFFFADSLLSADSKHVGNGAHDDEDDEIDYDALRVGSPEALAIVDKTNDALEALTEQQKVRKQLQNSSILRSLLWHVDRSLLTRLDWCRIPCPRAFISFCNSFVLRRGSPNSLSFSLLLRNFKASWQSLSVPSLLIRSALTPCLARHTSKVFSSLLMSQEILWRRH